MVKMGRPREFDREEALKQALFLFWNNGYDSTSLSQLKSKMGGISSPSLYSAFGSKADLFIEASQYYLDHYATVTHPLWDTTLSCKDAIEKTLRQSVDMQYESDHPNGCMIVLITMIPLALEDEYITKPLKDFGQQVHQGFIDCIQRGINSGEFSDDIDSVGLATLFEGFLLGISSLVRNNVEKTYVEYSITKLLKLLVQIPNPNDIKNSNVKSSY